MTSASRPQPKRASAAELNRGLSNGIEIAGVVLVFFGIGFGVDHWLGPGHWFTLGLTLFGIIGVFARTWYAYAAEMDRLEAERRGTPSPVVSEDRPA